MKLHVIIRCLWCAFLFLSFAPAAIIFLKNFGEIESLLKNTGVLFYLRLISGWLLIPIALISAFKVKWLYVFSIIHLAYGFFNFLANGLMKSFLQPIGFLLISLAIIAWHKKQSNKLEFVSELTNV